MSLIYMLKQKAFLMLAVLTMLSACKEPLYSQLTEADANEMVALLVLSGVPASREIDTGNGFSVMVEPEDLAVAVTVLRNSGLPRESFQSFGDVFGDVGVVGTPFEERIRFAHATNQELSQTISQIKGIDSARVHVVIPEKERFGATVQPARASIAIFHDRSFDPIEYSARIKALVAFAVPALEIDRISSTYFLSPGFVVEPGLASAVAQPGSAMASGAAGEPSFGIGWGMSVIGITLLLLVLLLVRVAMLGARKLRHSPFASKLRV